MRLLIKDKGQGKTTGLIYASEATGYPIVTFGNVQAKIIKDTAEQMGCVIPEPLTVDELKTRRLPSDTNVLLDEVTTILDKALKSYLGVNVVCATMSDDLKEKQIKIDDVMELLSKECSEEQHGELSDEVQGEV